MTSDEPSRGVCPARKRGPHRPKYIPCKGGLYVRTLWADGFSRTNRTYHVRTLAQVLNRFSSWLGNPESARVRGTDWSALLPARVISIPCHLCCPDAHAYDGRPEREERQQTRTDWVWIWIGPEPNGCERMMMAKSGPQPTTNNQNRTLNRRFWRYRFRFVSRLTPAFAGADRSEKRGLPGLPATHAAGC